METNPSQEGNRDLSAFIESANEKLLSAASSNAEQAFGMGCALGILPVSLVLALVFLFATRNWIILGLVGLAGALLVVANAAWLAFRARGGALEQTFTRVVAPEIQEYLELNSLSRFQFNQQAGEILPGDAPLLKYMAPLTSLETNPLQE